MSLLKRLLGDPGLSQADLQRQADEEIKQMMSQSSGPPIETQMPSIAPDQAASPEERPVKQ